MRDALPVSEQAFQAQVIQFAYLCGWGAYHAFDSRRSNEGFPDLVLWRERVIFVELKSARGKLSPAQEAVIADLRLAGAECYCWRPADWGQIEWTLAKPGKP